MKIKIKDLSKFVRGIIILLVLFVGFNILISNKSISHAETSYKTIYVTEGDTLWSIAKDELQNNAYYENNDIRDIISNIQSVNKLSNSKLATNQKLIIPQI